MMITDAKEACAQVPRGEKIARMNDLLRKSAEGGAIMATRSVRSLPGFCPVELMSALSAYDAFAADNDPHGERDFGDIKLFGADLLWKIDYYDTTMRFGSNDPADAEQTMRALTVMLSDEY